MNSVAILGHGIVGSGACELLQNNAKLISTRVHGDIELKYILEKRDFPEVPYNDKFVKDINIILADPSVSVVAECMGGVSFAYSAAKSCLAAKKSFVTSNKELVAAHGAELLADASAHGVRFLFEASVGGGIPVIRPLARCLAANDIHEINGILNGTSNFILHKMFCEGASFEASLADAQARGYAERDPSADVDGHDSARKIAILASIACGEHIYPEKIYTEGIRSITKSDIKAAEALGYVIKLIGRYKKLEGGKIEVSVEPSFVRADTPLGAVNGVYNGVVVSGNATEDITFIGRGAGKMPTASAVVADIIEAINEPSRPMLSWADTGAEVVGEYSEYIRDWFADGEIVKNQTKPNGERVFPICL